PTSSRSLPAAFTQPAAPPPNRGKRPPFGRAQERLSNGRIHERAHELDHQRRPPENPLAPDAEGRARKSLDQMSGYGPARLSQGRGSEPVGYPELELSHAHERNRAPEIHVRRRNLARHSAARSGD